MRIKSVQDVVQPTNDPATKKMCVILNCHEGPTSLCFDSKFEMGELIKVLAAALAQDHNIVTLNDNGSFDRNEFNKVFKEVPEPKPFAPPALQGTPMGEMKEAEPAEEEVVEDEPKTEENE